MPEDFAEELTQGKIKQYLEDKNGGTAFIFCAIFRSLEDVKKDIKEISCSIQPLVDESKKAQTVQSFLHSTKGKVVGLITCILLLVSFVGAIQQILGWWIK
jgi:hypothetical protein